jgi:hypothetical protein
VYGEAAMCVERLAHDTETDSMRHDQHHEIYRMEREWDNALGEEDAMPCDYSKYPVTWTAIRARIQERAGDKCEKCGVANRIYIVRSVDGSCWYDTVADAYFAYPSGKPLPDSFEADLREKGTVVCCTTAHIGAPHVDGTPGNKHDKHDCRDENLAFWCQACHLSFDLDDHIANRKRSTFARKAVSVLPGLEVTP